MAENEKSKPEGDEKFRKEVIKALLESAEPKFDDMKEPLGQCLDVIAATVDHKRVARNLFCAVTHYMAKNIYLDEEQVSVICRTIKQLTEDWVEQGNALSDRSKGPGYVDSTAQSDYGVTVTSSTDAEEKIASAAKESGGRSSGIVASSNKTKDNVASTVKDDGGDSIGGVREATEDNDGADALDDSAQVQEERGGAKAWQAYVADPQTGDKAAKAAYVHGSTTGMLQRGNIKAKSSSSAKPAAGAPSGAW